MQQHIIFCEIIGIYPEVCFCVYSYIYCVVYSFPSDSSLVVLIRVPVYIHPRPPVVVCGIPIAWVFFSLSLASACPFLPPRCLQLACLPTCLRCDGTNVAILEQGLLFPLFDPLSFTSCVIFSCENNMLTVKF